MYCPPPQLKLYGNSLSRGTQIKRKIGDVTPGMNPTSAARTSSQGHKSGYSTIGSEVARPIFLPIGSDPSAISLKDFEV